MKKADVQRAWGLRIKALRRQKGLTQEELAAAIGVSTDMVGSIEQGRAWTTFGNLLALASALGVGVGQLFERGITAPPIVIHTKDEVLQELAKIGSLLSPQSQKAVLEIAKQLRKAERKRI